MRFYCGRCDTIYDISLCSFFSNTVNEAKVTQAKVECPVCKVHLSDVHFCTFCHRIFPTHAPETFKEHLCPTKITFSICVACKIYFLPDPTQEEKKEIAKRCPCCRSQYKLRKTMIC